MRDSNIGQQGVDSIRIQGMKIDNLPMVPSAHVKEQLPKVYQTEKEQKIADIKAKYPKQTVNYLNSRIKECKENIIRVNDFINKLNNDIATYTGQISMCAHRDKLISKLHPEEDKEEIRELRKQFPLYDVAAMNTQIDQFKDSIDRGHEVIKQENESIAEHREILALCQQRDKELKQYS